MTEIKEEDDVLTVSKDFPSQDIVIKQGGASPIAKKVFQNKEQKPGDQTKYSNFLEDLSSSIVISQTKKNNEIDPELVKELSQQVFFSHVDFLANNPQIR